MKNLIPFSIISSALMITLVLLLLYLRGMGHRKNKNTHVTTMAAALLTQQDAILNYLSWLWKVKTKNKNIWNCTYGVFWEPIGRTSSQYWHNLQTKDSGHWSPSNIDLKKKPGLFCLAFLACTLVQVSNVKC